MNTPETPSPQLPHAINTKDPAAVAEVVRDIFGQIGFPDSIPLLERILEDVVSLFEGRRPGYQASDMHFHDLEHTLEVTVCALKILAGYSVAPGVAPLCRIDGVLLVAAALLHDSGYIKRLYDREGTGAKYTFIHERLSSTFAGNYLADLGLPEAGIADVRSAIGCTGPANRVPSTHFSRPAARSIATILVTADYLGQMAASDYVSKLPFLYSEFEQAYDYAQVPPEARPFKSAADLIRKTPGFWRDFVRPMLDADLDGVYHCIAPSEDGTNPYIAAVERNVALVTMLASAPDISLDPFGSKLSAIKNQAGEGAVEADSASDRSD